MRKFRTRTKALWWLLLLALLATANANAVPMTFIYRFADDGAVLIGEIDGTILMDMDTVSINSFGVVRFRGVQFPAISNTEFNTLPFGGTPMMSFSGNVLEFRACPSGFTVPDFQTGTPFQDCPFGTEGGLLLTQTGLLSFPNGFATAVDLPGSGTRSIDRSIVVGNWSLYVGTDPDVDGDGLAGDVDTAPLVPSIDFSDGPTSGTITNLGDQILFINDEPNPAGVRISASAAGGPIAATVSVCGGTANFTFSAGDELVTTCTSVQVLVITGEVEMEVEVDGETAIVSVPANNEVTYVPETATFTAPSTNSATIVVIIGGTEVPIAPGETSIFAAFDVFFADIEIEDDEFEIEGGFTLGSPNDGIDPLTEDVTVKVGTLAMTIPAGLFTLDDDGTFEFEGVIDGVELEVEIAPLGGDTFEFEIAAEADLTGTVNPVEVMLTIGNDGGTVSVIAELDDDDDSDSDSD